MPLGGRIDNSQSTYNNAAPTENKESRDSERESMFCLETPKYNFSEMILNNETYNSIQDVLTIYEKRRLLFDEWGLSKTHKQQNHAGINLYGAPGTGKTMAAHAIANQLGKQLLVVNYSQIESKYVGETSKNLVALFDYAKKTGAIIFFDEADALLSKRVTDMSNSTDVSVNQTRSVLLMLINDYTDIILFATNFITNYDPAFMRRILAHIKFDYPDEENRFKLWNLYIPKSLPTDADIGDLAARYAGVSGADISNAVFLAALRTARLGEKTVKHMYFEEAIARIIQSKEENENVRFTQRNVSEDYVKSQFGGVLPK